MVFSVQFWNLKSLLPRNALLLFWKAGFQPGVEIFERIQRHIAGQSNLNVQQRFLDGRIFELFHSSQNDRIGFEMQSEAATIRQPAVTVSMLNSFSRSVVCRSRQVQFAICHENISGRRIIEAKLPEPGGGSIWSAAG